MKIEPAPEFWTLVLIPKPPAEVIEAALVSPMLSPAVVARKTPAAVPDTDIDDVWAISALRKPPAVVSLDVTVNPTPDPEMVAFETI